jgi:hypothetical protein
MAQADRPGYSAGGLQEARREPVDRVLAHYGPNRGGWELNHPCVWRRRCPVDLHRGRAMERIPRREDVEQNDGVFTSAVVARLYQRPHTAP